MPTLPTSIQSIFIYCHMASHFDSGAVCLADHIHEYTLFEINLRPCSQSLPSHRHAEKRLEPGIADIPNAGLLRRQILIDAGQIGEQDLPGRVQGRATAVKSAGNHRRVVEVIRKVRRGSIWRLARLDGVGITAARRNS